MENGPEAEAPRLPVQDDLVRLCRELNRQGARYVVVGGFAVIQHGFLRATEDIDLLVEGSPENQAKVKKALEILPDQAVRELGDDDLRDWVVVRVADEVVVDLMQSACGIDYEGARAGIQTVEIQGVPIPFASPPLLLRMKQTHREKDAPDREFLEQKIRAAEPGRPAVSRRTSRPNLSTSERTEMALRTKIALELGSLALLSTAFLLAFPRRAPAEDFGLAAFALALIGVTAGYTKNVVWASVPSKPPGARQRPCWSQTLLFTGVVALLFLVIGTFIGFRTGGWAGVFARILNPGMRLALAFYLPWALAQQTLFQFYLLGRLAVLFPALPSLAIGVTGIAYSLVHLPDYATTAVTAVAGVVWSLLYFRYRLLLPLALSHAVLGSTFYYWVCGQNLAAGWSVMTPGLPGK